MARQKKPAGSKAVKPAKKPAKLNGHVTEHVQKALAAPRKRPVSKEHREYRGHAMLLNGYKPEYCKIVAEMVLNGALESEIRRQLKVTKNVFNEWKILYPDFAASLAITAEASLADARMVRSLYKQGLGYTVNTEKVFLHEGKVVRAKTRKHIPADFNAAKFWLQNRDPLRWSKGGGDGGGGGGQGAPSQINLNLIQNMDTDQLKNSIAVLQGIMGQGGGGGKIVRIDKESAVEAEVVEVKDKKAKK